MAEKVLFSFLGKSPKDKLVAIMIIIIVVVVGFFLIKRGYTSLMAFINEQKYKIDLNQEIANGGGLSFSDVQFNSYANKLYASMKGVGTNEEAIFEVFNSIRTRADLLKLISVFGIKDEMSLSQWLYDDLSVKDLGKINAILSMKNIDYSF